MLCIKEKCRYYEKHQFQQSYYKCDLGEFAGRKKDVDYYCIIENYIQETKDELEALRLYSFFIEGNQ